MEHPVDKNRLWLQDFGPPRSVRVRELRGSFVVFSSHYEWNWVAAPSSGGFFVVFSSHYEGNWAADLLRSADLLRETLQSTVWVSSYRGLLLYRGAFVCVENLGHERRDFHRWRHPATFIAASIHGSIFLMQQEIQTQSLVRQMISIHPFLERLVPSI